MVLHNPGAAVTQRQLWPEGSCYVGLQAGKRIIQYCVLFVFNSLIICQACRHIESPAEPNP